LPRPVAGCGGDPGKGPADRAEATFGRSGSELAGESAPVTQWLDFSSFMALIVVVSGAIWAVDAWLLAPRRRLAGAASTVAGEDPIRFPPKPVVVEYARSFFPVFLAVFLIRSFVIEPFRIPSGSMMPTLLIGDFIAVNKFSYGIRLPVTNRKVFEVGQPERGDVVVFRYPVDGETIFIKRIVGLPGDRIRYDRDKMLHINGVETDRSVPETYEGTGSGSHMTGARQRFEALGEHTHAILYRPGQPTVEGEWVVPVGQYFVLGDNRDKSHDSRFWGFVPEENLVGPASVVWMSWDWGHGVDFGRIGTSID
jgi:signal peptidase I